MNIANFKGRFFVILNNNIYEYQTLFMTQMQVQPNDEGIRNVKFYDQPFEYETISNRHKFSASNKIFNILTQKAHTFHCKSKLLSA